ncbi:MAG: site-2 protease family protein [Bdellovibrionales bacterium]|nr:site-2 protease family protein [Bdellovibrionales bacterium]
MELIYKFFMFYVPLLFSLCVHEFAHAWMAKQKGDLTAEMEGRLSLNPVVHMDIVGTLFLPLMAIFTGLPVFGWAKPVPFNESVLKNPKQDVFWIALAGPLSNFLLAFLGAFVLLVYRLLSFSDISILQWGEVFIYINLLLGFFNLIPLHPLDGGKVIARFLSARWNQWLEDTQRYSTFILIGLFVFGGFHYIAFPAYVLTKVLTSFPSPAF